MRKMFAPALCAGLVLAYVAPSALAGGNEVIVSDQDAGKTVSVSPGEPLTVKLPGRHGEGYWRLDADLTPQLTLSGRTMQSLALPGADEQTVFTFTPRTAGTVTLKASYVKGGSDPSPSSRFSITVNVSGS